MSVFDDWSEFIVKVLESESSLVKAFLKNPTEIGDAREALIKGVLSKILPSIYEVGSGEIIDCLGKRSKQIDIVIFRKDFPTLKMPSGSRLFLVESVLAAIEVKSDLRGNNLKMALDNIYSVMDLSPNVIAGIREKIAREKGLEFIKEKGDYQHKEPLETGRFDLIGRPIPYIFGFHGYKKVEKLREIIQEWGDEKESKEGFAMRHIPAFIFSDKLFGWRNADPYSNARNSLLFLGEHKSPLRFFILHLLYSLHRKIPILPDAYGVKHNLEIYLQQMENPLSRENIKFGLFSALNK
ncbi:MAG: DUF6602 domain-containing protein [Patescibacteria group bacterium]